MQDIWITKLVIERRPRKNYGASLGWYDYCAYFVSDKKIYFNQVLRRLKKVCHESQQDNKRPADSEHFSVPPIHTRHMKSNSASTSDEEREDMIPISWRMKRHHLEINTKMPATKWSRRCIHLPAVVPSKSLRKQLEMQLQWSGQSEWKSGLLLALTDWLSSRAAQVRDLQAMTSHLGIGARIRVWLHTGANLKIEFFI
jgi:hypothetical protein